jgi:hypothetical protein
MPTIYVAQLTMVSFRHYVVEDVCVYSENAIYFHGLLTEKLALFC